MLTGKVARVVQIAFNFLHKILMRQKELLNDEFYMVSLNGWVQLFILIGSYTESSVFVNQSEWRFIGFPYSALGEGSIAPSGRSWWIPVLRRRRARWKALLYNHAYGQDAVAEPDWRWMRMLKAHDGGVRWKERWPLILGVTAYRWLGVQSIGFSWPERTFVQFNWGSESKYKWCKVPPKWSIVCNDLRQRTRHHSFFWIGSTGSGFCREGFNHSHNLDCSKWVCSASRIINAWRLDSPNSISLTEWGRTANDWRNIVTASHEVF